MQVAPGVNTLSDEELRSHARPHASGVEDTPTKTLLKSVQHEDEWRVAMANSFQAAERRFLYNSHCELHSADSWQGRMKKLRAKGGQRS